ncbi:ribosomal protein L13e [Hyaloraphidium curvatum]|nr:ribosomal protein L13e [Hyaloraphidium curvatum]
MRHNNQLPNAHFRKLWQERVKTHFDQPGRKKRRRAARAAKAARIAPRPVDGLLRPAVRGQTVKYNTKLRAGRGFTLDELKAAGIRRKEARSIGIAVDHRRKNRSEESLAMNVERLKEYKSKLIVFPKRAGKAKKGDASAEEIKEATQLKGKLFPIVAAAVEQEFAAVESAEGPTAFATLRKASNAAKYKGLREKIAKEKAAAAADAAK